MYFAAYAFLLLALLCAVGGAGIGAAQLWQGRSSDLGLVEKANLGVTVSMLAASYLLLYALASSDFSVMYVASYTDRVLPLFYRLTAFWAGQAGSLLFWGLMVAVCGAIFQFTSAYRALSTTTRLWYWVFFLSIMAFFGLLLCAWSNPFVMLSHPPADGNGLNPMLQNPGMIIHPPLLFLGYGGFVIPGCLALAQAMRRAGERQNHLPPAVEDPWLQVARPFTMTAWLFLTAGVVLGAWWAYMELGWGGYWAWDPVENASLIPWLLATAALHTGLIETRRNKLHRVNIFLMTLTTVSAFFATYLVRGNVVNSVHSFGSGTVGPALLLFVLVSLGLALVIALQGKVDDADSLGGLETREGFLVMTAWMLIALSVIILLATLSPVISGLWSSKPIGLDAQFYNNVCLPLFTVLVALLAICPWLGWRGGVRNWRKFAVVVGVFVIALGLFWKFGIRSAMPLMADALCTAAIASLVLLMTEKSSRNLPFISSSLVHLGLVLLALGIAFSGPYKEEVEIEIARGDSVQVGPYTVELTELYEGQDGTGAYAFLEAQLTLRKSGTVVGIVSPQRRVYTKYSQSPSSEAATYFSLGKEFYASLLGLDSQQRAVLRMSANPLVNWLWIGGALMTLAPLLALGKHRLRRKHDVDGNEAQ